MAAVITDRRGRVIAWGWNHAGADGTGMCAERHAIARANPARMLDATVHVRGSQQGKESASTPCRKCHEALTKAGIRRIEYSTRGEKERRLTRLDALAAESAAYIVRRRRTGRSPSTNDG